ncbi:Non-structural maintenance of chromosomes element 4 homolog A [Linum grandiflorum]
MIYGKRERIFTTGRGDCAVEHGGSKDRVFRTRTRRRIQLNPDTHDEQQMDQSVEERRILRSKYRALQNRISEERDDLTNVDSDKFDSFVKQVDHLHQYVQKPREQVADAQTLLSLTTTLLSSVKAHSRDDGVTVGEFVAQLRNAFQESITTRSADQENSPPISLSWKEIGLFVSPILSSCSCGFTTMLGPMDTEIKQRKQYATQGSRSRPPQIDRPNDVDDTGDEERTDTDKNMATMFGILRSKKRVRLESLILNRRSFAQTVENLFALSFLVKDGRVQIIVDDNNTHFVIPRNAPSADSVMSKDVSYTHFVFRFNFADWKLTKDIVADGEELMPDRDSLETAGVADTSPGTQTNCQYRN